MQATPSPTYAAPTNAPPALRTTLQPTTASVILLTQSLFCLLVACAPTIADKPPRASRIAEKVYSYSTDTTGGVAVVQVDAQTGKLLKSQRLFESETCRRPLKVRRSGRNTIAVTNLTKSGPHLHLFPRNAPSDVQSFELPSIPDEIRFAKESILVTCEEDAVVAVDPAAERITRVMQMDEMLMPPANAPEDIHIVGDAQFAVVSFQKDSSSGKKKGNRLVVFALPELKLVGDLALPRNRPDLHIEKDKKQQGPGPEVVYVSKPSNALTVTLDLYGGVGVANWHDAKNGQLTNWHVVSSSTTGSWGEAFPDRTTAFSRNGKDYLIVCNAGAEGGASLIDIEQRMSIWKRETPPGLESPVYIERLHQAFSVCSGKTKQRTPDGVEKTFDPKQFVFVMDFRSDSPSVAPLIEVPIDVYTIQITRLASERPLLLIAGGTDADRPNQLLTFDPVRQTVIDSLTVDETIIRFER